MYSVGMNEAKKTARKKRLQKLYKELTKQYPKAKLALTYNSPWELLVAVQLSAQSTDKKVNQITPEIFKKYKTMKSIAKANLEDFTKSVSKVLYYRNKAKNIQGAAKKLLKDFNGEIPKTMKEMLTLPGVARKTGNVILGNVYGVYEGIVVDTHMIRFARRFDLTDYTDAVRIEKDLMEILPKKNWFEFSYKVVEYGREYGNPRGKRELHDKDPLIKHYKKAANYWPK